MKYKKTSSIIREYTDSYSKLCTESCTVPKELYSQFGVKRGLRDENGGCPGRTHKYFINPGV